jgi:hypothetical protein
MVDPIERDLAQNGVIRSGWSVSEHDGDIDKWPARLYADANHRIVGKIMALFPPEKDLLLATTLVRLVPDAGGYEVLVLSGKRLTDAQQELVQKAASEAMEEAHASWRSRLREMR